MIVIQNGVRHEMFPGIGVSDSTACGLLVGDEDAPRGEGEVDCMACITYDPRFGPILLHNIRALVKIP